MSGGHYDYTYFKVEELADRIESDFVKDGKYLGEDWSIPVSDYFGARPLIEYDRLEDATDEQRIIILKEISKLVADLKACSVRAKELEWYMSGDTGASSYIERLNLKP